MVCLGMFSAGSSTVTVVDNVVVVPVPSLTMWWWLLFCCVPPDHIRFCVLGQLWSPWRVKMNVFSLLDQNLDQVGRRVGRQGPGRRVGHHLRGPLLRSSRRCCRHTAWPLLGVLRPLSRHDPPGTRHQRGLVVVRLSQNVTSGRRHVTSMSSKVY